MPTPLQLTLLLLLLFPVSAFTSEATTAATAPEQTRLQILTPSFQDRQTLTIKLDNGLEALLISDPKAPQSAAALAVHVGSWKDPENAMGMAHFCEHMLFLGTEEYPEENSFQRFVMTNQGEYSAYTAHDRTCYLFSIETPAFPEALSRYSSFFKKPLFSISGAEREINAIDGEFSSTTKSDSRRRFAVLRELANPEHPLSRFSAGNKESLAAVTNEQLRSWYNEHYSANIMRLVIYSPLSLTELQSLVDLPGLKAQFQYRKKIDQVESR